MSRRGRFARTCRDLWSGTRARLHGRDLALASAAGTLYGALAVVPSLLVAVSMAGLIIGRDAVRDYGDTLAATIPAAMGADTGVTALVGAGLALSPLGVVFAVVMGSAYGEGLSRALVRFAPEPDLDERPAALWQRAMTLPLLGLAPLSLCLLLVAAPSLSRVATDSPAGPLTASYLSLNLVWVLTWLPLTWTFRVVGPGRPPWRCAFAGAVVTGAFVSGFLQGFLVFLALPVDLGRPFGGLLGVGVASALLLWLWVLHAVVCVGYAFTWAVVARQGAPGRSPRGDGAGTTPSDGGEHQSRPAGAPRGAAVGP